MTPHSIPLDQLLRALPRVPELAPLREAVLGASVPDPELAWLGSAAYATYDARVLPAARLEEVVRTATDAARRRTERLMEGVAAALRAVAADDADAVVRHAVALGEAAESGGAWSDALACYEVASGFALGLDDRRPLALALRRTARVRWTRGETEPALALYRASLEQAEAAADAEGCIVALTGLGNVRHAQGSWVEARAHYEAGRALCGEAHPVLLGHILLNLSNVSRLEARLDEAREWLDRALALVDRLGAADQTIWFMNDGLLWLTRGELDRAEAAFRQALERAPGAFQRALVFENLATVAMHRGSLDDAERLARRAEDEALAAGSSWALAAVYLVLGKVCRARGDANGVTFFEKSLEICRRHGYLRAEGLALLEYGIYRGELGAGEEARLYLEQARERFAGLGSRPDLERAEQAIVAAS